MATTTNETYDQRSVSQKSEQLSRQYEPKSEAISRASKDQSRAKSSVASHEKSEFEQDDGTCSLVIDCGGRKLYCHRDFLCIWSPVFKRMCNPEVAAHTDKTEHARGEDGFEEGEEGPEEELTYTPEGLLQISLEQDYEDVKEFLKCLYPNETDVDERNVDQIVALAHEFETNELKNKCEDVLLHRHSNLELMFQAEIYGLVRLKNQVARDLASKPLVVVEQDAIFDELNEESKMLLWRERAILLESEQEHVDELNEKMHQLVKILVRKHPCCNTIAESNDSIDFGNVSITTRDPKGKKKREQISDAAQFKIDQISAGCKECMKQLGHVAKARIADLDKERKFDKSRVKERHRGDEHFCHGHFKYKASFSDALK